MLKCTDQNTRIIMYDMVILILYNGETLEGENFRGLVGSEHFTNHIGVCSSKFSWVAL